MKKLLFLSVIFVLALVSLNSYGQAYSTGVKPYPGATHTYQVPKVGANTYTWNLYKGAVGTAVPASEAIVTPADNIVTIKWADNVTVSNEYVLVLTEATTSGLSCQNTVALPVQIVASEFDLEVLGNGDACYTAPVTVAWTGGQNASNVKYTHGNATLIYTVSATGLGTSESWSFKPNLTYDQGVTPVSIDVKKGSTTLVATNDIYTVTGGPGSVTVTVIVNNTIEYTNSSTANAQNFTGTLTLSDVASGTGAVEKQVGAKSNNAAVAVKRPDRAVIQFD